MSVGVICVRGNGPGVTIPRGTAGINYFENSQNLVSPCVAYQMMAETTLEDYQIYIHDDVTIHDADWLDPLYCLFFPMQRSGQPIRKGPAVVGLGGAHSLGSPDLYKKPYALPLMARRGYESNQTDWQTHGGHLTEPKRVAVVDAFFMAVRRDFLERIGGWPTKHLTHHCLDLWICCEAARHNEEVLAVPISCTHHGGGTSTKAAYSEAKWLQGGTLASDHTEPHKWLYENYRDVLPLEVRL